MTDHVADKEELSEKIDSKEVVALAAAEDNAAEFSEELGDPSERARADLALHLQRLVHVLGEVAEGLLAHFWIEMLHVVDWLDQGADVKAGLGAERVPHHRRRVEHERLQEQDERHPLVVADVGFLEIVRSGHFFFPRQVVCIRDPTNVVGILNVWAGELSRNPAGNCCENYKEEEEVINKFKKLGEKKEKTYDRQHIAWY